MSADAHGLAELGAGVRLRSGSQFPCPTIFPNTTLTTSLSSIVHPATLDSILLKCPSLSLDWKLVTQT